MITKSHTPNLCFRCMKPLRGGHKYTIFIDGVPHQMHKKCGVEHVIEKAKVQGYPL